MGRGNCCVTGKYEGLFYIDNDDLCVYVNPDDEDEKVLRRNIPFEDLCLWEFSDQDTEWWEGDVLEALSEAIRRRFPSFGPCDKWLNRERHALLENRLFYIAIEDNQWAMAVELIQKEEPWGDPWMENFQKRFYEEYLNGIRDALFEQFESIGTYSGAWTSGTLHREEVQG